VPAWMVAGEVPIASEVQIHAGHVNAARRPVLIGEQAPD
jgi:hypothetical protein